MRQLAIFYLLFLPILLDHVTAMKRQPSEEADNERPSKRGRLQTATANKVEAVSLVDQDKEGSLFDTLPPEIIGEILRHASSENVVMVLRACLINRTWYSIFRQYNLLEAELMNLRKLAYVSSHNFSNMPWLYSRRVLHELFLGSVERKEFYCQLFVAQKAPEGLVSDLKRTQVVHIVRGHLFRTFVKYVLSNPDYIGVALKNSANYGKFDFIQLLFETFPDSFTLDDLSLALLHSCCSEGSVPMFKLLWTKYVQKFEETHLQHSVDNNVERKYEDEHKEQQELLHRVFCSAVDNNSLLMATFLFTQFKIDVSACINEAHIKSVAESKNLMLMQLIWHSQLNMKDPCIFSAIKTIVRMILAKKQVDLVNRGNSILFLENRTLTTCPFRFFKYLVEVAGFDVSPQSDSIVKKVIYEYDEALMGSFSSYTDLDPVSLLEFMETTGKSRQFKSKSTITPRKPRVVLYQDLLLHYIISRYPTSSSKILDICLLHAIKASKAMLAQRFCRLGGRINLENPKKIASVVQSNRVEIFTFLLDNAISCSKADLAVLLNHFANEILRRRRRLAYKLYRGQAKGNLTLDECFDFTCKYFDYWIALIDRCDASMLTVMTFVATKYGDVLLLRYALEKSLITEMPESQVLSNCTTVEEKRFQDSDVMDPSGLLTEVSNLLSSARPTVWSFLRVEKSNIDTLIECIFSTEYKLVFKMWLTYPCWLTTLSSTNFHERLLHPLILSNNVDLVSMFFQLTPKSILDTENFAKLRITEFRDVCRKNIDSVEILRLLLVPSDTSGILYGLRRAIKNSNTSVVSALLSFVDEKVRIEVLVHSFYSSKNEMSLYIFKLLAPVLSVNQFHLLLRECISLRDDKLLSSLLNELKVIMQKGSFSFSESDVAKPPKFNALKEEPAQVVLQVSAPLSSMHHQEAGSCGLLTSDYLPSQASASKSTSTLLNLDFQGLLEIATRLDCPRKIIFALELAQKLQAVFGLYKYDPTQKSCQFPSSIEVQCFEHREKVKEGYTNDYLEDAESHQSRSDNDYTDQLHYGDNMHDDDDRDSDENEEVQDYEDEDDDAYSSSNRDIDLLGIVDSSSSYDSHSSTEY